MENKRATIMFEYHIEEDVVVSEINEQSISEIAFEKICEKIGEGGKWHGGFEFDFGIDEEGEVKITVDFWTTLS